MVDGINKQIKDGPAVVELMKWFSRAALEYIARGGLGHSFGPLDDEISTAYSDAVKKIS